MGVYTDFLIPASNFLARVEQTGLIYDVSRAADLYENEVGPELDQLILDMRNIVDNPLFNPRSHVHLAALWYDKWQVKHAMQHRPVTPQMQNPARSMDKAARLEILAGRYTHKFGDEQTIVAATEKLHRYKTLDKQATTYIIGMIERAVLDPESRIYTSLSLFKTVTGRLSSTEPNLQNITRAKDDLPNIRDLFESPRGRQLVQADYSQAELRAISCLSGDSKLKGIYERGEDLHDTVATRFYGEKFTYEQRSKCKNMNFGVAYRQSAATFQEKHNIPEKEAQKFIDWWWTEFPSVKAWEKTLEDRIHKDGVIVAPYGNRRRFHLITKENKEALYREGINFLPQNTASNLTVDAAMVVADNIDWKRACISLLVHDSILAEVDDNYVDEYTVICKQAMEERPLAKLGWSVPFMADTGVGSTWGTVA